VDRLKEILCDTLRGYAGKALNGYSYLTVDDQEQVFAVIDFGWYKDERIADAGLIVRLEGDTIIIERDLNDKVLVDALVQAGIPRQQIVLAYAGETLRETTPS
jgi:hypothetical protein